MNNSSFPLLQVDSLYKAYYQSLSSVSSVKHLFLLSITGRQPKPSCDVDFSLSNVSFDLMPGDSLALLGRNGAGKSTLLKIIAGVLMPTAGQLSRPARITAILELGIGMNPFYSGRKNAYRYCRFSGFSHFEAISKLKFIEKFADIGLYFDQPIKTYSSGMFARLAFSCAIYVESDLLLLDEILSVGDLAFTQKCVQFLQNQYLSNPNKSVIYVGHNTDVAERICNRGLVLEKGQTIHHGSVSDSINAYHQTLAYKSSSNNSSDSFILNDFSPVDLSHSIPSGYGLLEEQPFFNTRYTSVGPKHPVSISSILVSPCSLDSQFGSNISFDFLITVNASQDCFVAFGFSTSTLEGIVITGASSFLRGQVIQLSSGSQETFKLSVNLNLNPGKYTSNIGLDIIDSSGSPCFCDVKRQVLLFEVLDPFPQNAGLIPLDFQLSAYN